MYLYFDRNGLLKEQINDDSLRQGNINYNKIYVYIDSDIVPSNIFARYRNGSGVLVQTQFDIPITTVPLKIPYDKNRDLKYFNYTQDFNFYVIDIPDAIMQVSGATACSVRIDSNSGTITLSTFAFMVEESVEGGDYVASDNYISLAQYNYLLSRLDSKNIDFTVFDAETTEEQSYIFPDFRAYTNQPMYEIKSNESVTVGWIMDDNDKYTGFTFKMNQVSESVDEILVVFYFRG